MRQVSLCKNGHWYIFRYHVGKEADVIESMATLALNDSDFDWFDAAILSYQIGRRIELSNEKVS